MTRRTARIRSAFILNTKFIIFLYKIHHFLIQNSSLPESSFSIEETSFYIEDLHVLLMKFRFILKNLHVLLKKLRFMLKNLHVFIYIKGRPGFERCDFL